MDDANVLFPPWWEKKCVKAEVYHILLFSSEHTKQHNMPIDPQMNDDIYSTCILGIMDLPVLLMLVCKKFVAVYWLVHPAPTWE